MPCRTRAARTSGNARHEVQETGADRAGEPESRGLPPPDAVAEPPRREAEEKRRDRQRADGRADADISGCQLVAHVVRQPWKYDADAEVADRQDREDRPDLAGQCVGIVMVRSPHVW